MWAARWQKQSIEVSGATCGPPPPPPAPPPPPPSLPSPRSKAAPAVTRPHGVSSPRTPAKSNRSSPAKSRSCSKGGVRVETTAAGEPELAMSADSLGPADKRLRSRCQRQSGSCSTSGRRRLGLVSGNYPPRPRDPATPPPPQRPGRALPPTPSPGVKVRRLTQGPVRVLSYSSFIYLID